MKITILGSGTCIPNKRRGSSGYFIETGENKVLFDCGNGTTWKLDHIGVLTIGQWRQIDKCQ